MRRRARGVRVCLLVLVTGVLLPALAGADLLPDAPKSSADHEYGEKWPRSSPAVGLGVYGGSEASGIAAGGELRACAFCIYWNENRFVVGDSHFLRLGYADGGMGGRLAEGILVTYGLYDEVDIGARILWHTYDNGADAESEGGCMQLDARWEQATGSLSYAFDGKYIAADGRFMFDRIYGLEASVERGETENIDHPDGESALSFRLTLQLIL